MDFPVTILRPNCPAIFAAGGASYDAASQAVFDAMTTPPSTQRKTDINTFILALKAASIWASLDSLWVLAAADSQAALLDWKAPSGTPLVASNAPTFTADRGFTGNGSNAALTGPTNYSAMAQFTQNAAHISVYSRTVGADGAPSMGYAASANVFVRCRNGSDLISWLVNQTSTDTVANTDGSGHFIVNRSGAGATQAYRNGVSIGTGTQASSAPPANAPTILGGNGAFASTQIALASIGNDLNSGTLASDFYNAVQAYMTAVGA